MPACLIHIASSLTAKIELLENKEHFPDAVVKQLGAMSENGI
jgi:hypothetical protein